MNDQCFLNIIFINTLILYNLIATFSAFLKFRAAVHPSVEPTPEKITENKVTTPPLVNEETLQLHSIISDISVISDPRLLIPPKTNLKTVKIQTKETDDAES